MENIEEIISTMKETLIFLVEQEKIRGEEVAALNDKIEAVNSAVMGEVINPLHSYQKEQRFNDFNSKYGERLGKHNDIIGASMGNPDYDLTKSAFEDYDNAENKDEIDVDKYVDSIEGEVNAWVDNLKEKMNLPEDTAVEIKDDGNGNIEVKADEDGDGTPETPVETEETKTEEASTEEKEEEPTDDGGIDPELKAQLEEWSKK